MHSKLDAVRIEASVRLFHWLKSDAVVEASQGFPIIGSTNGKSAIHYLWTIKSLPVETIRSYLLARIHFGMQDVAILCNEPLTSSEIMLLNEFRALNTENYGVVMTRIFQSSSEPKVAPSKLRIMLKKNRNFKIMREKGNSTEFFIKARAGKFTIITDIDTGGAFQLRVSHRIYYGDELSNEFLVRQYEIPDNWWLGPGEWDLITDSTVDRDVAFFLSNIDRFFKVLNNILGDI